jgi:hypothetical protein
MQRADKLVKMFQEENGIPLKLRKTKVLSSIDGAMYDLRTRQILIPADAKGELLKEYVYHEIGHALIQQYKIPRTMLRHFVELSPKLSRDRAHKLYHDGVGSPKGWVSWYAMVTGTEDFCDTLAAYCCNDYRKRGHWVFENFYFDLNQNRILQRKILWVDRILEYCAARAY